MKNGSQLTRLLVCQVRRGVQPGSFIDLLMRAKDKTTGQGFTDLEIANQVALSAIPLLPSYTCILLPALCRHWQASPPSAMHTCLSSPGMSVAMLATPDMCCMSLQGFVLVLAGYETTGNALGFALYLLAAHPARQRQLVQEVRKFGLNRRPSYESLQELPFVEACLKEALRLYPPAPTHIR